MTTSQTYVASGGGGNWYCLAWIEVLARVYWLIHGVGIHRGNVRVERGRATA